MSASEPTGKIITFYSYKGGTGRSMAVANIAWILASAGHSVLVLDWDLEAPGLHRYFRPFLIDKELLSSEGIIDFIIEFCDEAIRPAPEGQQLPADWYIKFADITRYRISLDYEDFPRGGKIDFVCAGQQGPSYATRVNSFNWQDFYQRLGGGAFIDAMRDQMRERYDYVLIDSRTGVSDTAGICTVQLPDTLAIFFTFNNQSITGAAAVAQSVFEQRKDKIRGEHRFRVLPVPTRADQTERDKLDQRKVYARKCFDPFLEQIRSTDRASYWDNVEIPYVAWFAYEEVLSPFKDSAADPKTVLASMKRITDFMVQPEIERFEFNPLISPEKKQAILMEFAATPFQAQEETPAGVQTESRLEKSIRLAEGAFLSLTESERDSARRLWLRLVRVPQPGERIENSKVRVPVEELTGIPENVTAKFLAAEVLVSGLDDKTKEVTLEVANEDLLRNWKRLLEWIDQDYEFLLWRQGLQNRLAEWESTTTDSSLNLLQKESLNEAVQWKLKRSADLSDAERHYIDYSEILSERRKTRSKARLVFAFASVIVLLAAVFTIKTYLSYRQRNSAAKNLVQQAEGIIKSSTSLPGKLRVDQLQLGILLELEAAQLSPSSETERLITEHLAMLPRQIAKSVQDRNVQRVALPPSADRLVAILGRSSSFSGPVEDKTLIVQETASRKQLGSYSFQAASNDLILSNDGKFLAFLPGDSRLLPAGSHGVEILWNLTKNERISIPLAGPVVDGIFSPDDRYLALATASGTFVIDLNLSFAKHIVGKDVFLSDDVPSQGVEFNSKGDYLAVIQEKRVVVKNISGDGKPIIFQIDASSLQRATLSPSGNSLATASFSLPSISIWDTFSGKQTATLNAVDPAEFVFTPDDRMLLFASHGVDAWEIGPPSNRVTLTSDTGLSSVFGSDDGRYFAAIGSNVARIWSYSNGSFEDVALLTVEGTLNDLAFSGKSIVATASSDNTIRLWDLNPPATPKPDATDYCARLTKNLTNTEWVKYLGSETYHQACPNFDVTK